MNEKNIIEILKGFENRIGMLERQTLRNLTFPSTGKLVIPVYVSPPTIPERGQIYFDSSLSKARIYDGTVWQNLY